MSVDTAADEHLKYAKRDIQSATENLSKIVVDQCWGHDEFSAEYSSRIKQAFAELLQVRDLLGE